MPGGRGSTSWQTLAWGWRSPRAMRMLCALGAKRPPDRGLAALGCVGMTSPVPSTFFATSLMVGHALGSPLGLRADQNEASDEGRRWAGFSSWRWLLALQTMGWARHGSVRTSWEVGAGRLCDGAGTVEGRWESVSASPRSGLVAAAGAVARRAAVLGGCEPCCWTTGCTRTAPR